MHANAVHFSAGADADALRAFRAASNSSSVQPSGASQSAGLDVRWQVLPGHLEKAGGSEHLFQELYGSPSQPDAFWLDR